MNIEEAIDNVKFIIGDLKASNYNQTFIVAIETLLTAYEKEANRKLDKEAQGYLEELAGDGSMNIRRIQELEAELEKEKEKNKELQDRIDYLSRISGLLSTDTIIEEE